MDKNYRLGIFYGLGAYLLWGVLPIYWKRYYQEFLRSERNSAMAASLIERKAVI